MRVALFQPDIPQNTGTIIRLCACLGVALDIIEPCGFTFTDKQLRRAAMDYGGIADVTRHRSWEKFLLVPRGRLVLLTTKATDSYCQFEFAADDTLLLGREQAGVPEDVHKRVDSRVSVPMQEGARSLNVAVAAAMVLGEALRQAGRF
jgi:tRNA (cytidine/uridine-2'-O-)-methyltransferase